MEDDDRTVCDVSAALDWPVMRGEQREAQCLNQADYSDKLMIGHWRLLNGALLFVRPNVFLPNLKNFNPAAAKQSAF